MYQQIEKSSRLPRAPKWTVRLCCTLLFVPVLAKSAIAETHQLICENPRREYVVHYRSGDPNIEVHILGGTTLYPILAVEQTETQHVVVGLTTADGPTVRLMLRPNQRMEYWTGISLLQTDACRAP